MKEDRVRRSLVDYILIFVKPVINMKSCSKDIATDEEQD